MDNLLSTQLQNAKNIGCEKCNNEVYTQVYVIKHISALMTQTGKETIFPVPIFMCSKCNHINSLFTNELKINSTNSNAEELMHVQV